MLFQPTSFPGSWRPYTSHHASCFVKATVRGSPMRSHPEGKLKNRDSHRDSHLHTRPIATQQ